MSCVFTWLHREHSAKTHLQSLWPVLSELDNDLIFQMEKSRQNANGSSKNTLWLKIGDRRDSDRVFAKCCKRYPRKLLLSILEAMFTESPNRQYRGLVIPTTPATMGLAKGRTEAHDQSVFPKCGTPQCKSGQQKQVNKYAGSSLWGQSLEIDLRVYNEANYRTHRVLVESNIINCYGLNVCVSHPNSPAEALTSIWWGGGAFRW